MSLNFFCIFNKIKNRDSGNDTGWVDTTHACVNLCILVTQITRNVIKIVYVLCVNSNVTNTNVRSYQKQA